MTHLTKCLCNVWNDLVDVKLENLIIDIDRMLPQQLWVCHRCQDWLGQQLWVCEWVLVRAVSMHDTECKSDQRVIHAKDTVGIE